MSEMPDGAIPRYRRTDMAEDNHTRPRYITGRQSAHLTFSLRVARPSTHADRDELPDLPEVSVVSWEVREEIGEPYCVKAVGPASDTRSPATQPSSVTTRSFARSRELPEKIVRAIYL